jgi:CheY-like chemotaxis protein
MNISTDVKFFTNPLDGITFIKEHCIKEDANVNECPNLIFLDINMPQMSGFEFMDKLKVFHKDYLFKDVIVMLSSSNNAKDISQAKEYGIRGYLEKPLTEDKVRSIDN